MNRQMPSVVKLTEIREGKVWKVDVIPSTDWIISNDACEKHFLTDFWHEVLEDGTVIHHEVCGVCGKDKHFTVKPQMPRPVELRCSCTLKQTLRREDVWVNGQGQILARDDVWKYELKKGSKHECGRYIRPVTYWEREEAEREGRTPPSDQQKLEEAKRTLYEKCLQKESFNPKVIYSPKVPSHEHAPFKGSHPVSRKHRDKAIHVKRYIFLDEWQKWKERNFKPLWFELETKIFPSEK